MAYSNTRFTAENGILSLADSSFSNNVFIGGSANIAGDFTVGGSVVFTANVTGNFIPDVSGRALGNTANRWQLFANGGNFSNTVVIAGNTTPTTNGVSLGESNFRWFLFSSGANVVGTSTTTELVTTNTASVGNTLTVANNVTITSRVNLAGNTATITGTTQQVIDTYPSGTYRTAKYLIEARDNNTAGAFLAAEILLTHDSSVVSMTEYSMVLMTTAFTSFDADISGGSVRLLATSTSSNTTYKVARTLLI